MGTRRPVQGGLGSWPPAVTPTAHGRGDNVRSPHGNAAEAQTPRARLPGASVAAAPVTATPEAPRARVRRAAEAAGPVPLPLSSPPSGAREGRAGPASLPGSGGRRRLSGGFPPRPPAALGDASPITARGEPPLWAPLSAGPASPAPLPA